MAIKRRRRVRRAALTYQQEWELLLGPPSSWEFDPAAPPRLRSAFPTPWDRIRAWREHRERLLADEPDTWRNSWAYQKWEVNDDEG